MEKNNDQPMTTNEYTWKKSRIITEILLLVLTVSAGVGAGFLYGKSQTELVGLAVLAAAGTGAVLFSLEQSIQAGTFLFEGKDHIAHFVLAYLISLAGSLIFPLLPTGGWPYLTVFVALMLFSNQVTGLSAASMLLVQSCILAGNGSCFFVYFIGGLVGIMVFSYLEQNFLVGRPLVTALLTQMVCLCVSEVLGANEKINVTLFLVPGINILVCLILLFVILKAFSISVIYKKSDLYTDMNDPECTLLASLKETSKEQYYHAVHTAYLCDRIARKLGMDEQVAKACGYYHRIGTLKGENNWENTSSILEENHFPEQIRAVLKEYLDASSHITRKETVVLLFSDTVISSVRYLFSKNPKIHLDYDKFIGDIFKKRMESGMIEESDITLKELKDMKKILMEEKLYYDFLR